MYDLQKADVWKRISALLFDMIMLVIVVIGSALLLSVILRYDSYSQRLEAVQNRYQQECGISFDISVDEYDAMSEDERKLYDEAYAAFAQDEEAVHVYGMLINLTFIIVTFSILIGFLLLEFLIPLLLRNGQTLGKKIFGIGVMREDGVRLSPLLLFVRTVLGKYTVETMVPVMIVLMFLFNVIGIEGTLLLLGLAVVQIVLIVSSRARTPIHDKIAHTVTVDLSSQRIFESPEALLAYKEKVHAARAQNADY